MPFLVVIWGLFMMVLISSTLFLIRSSSQVQLDERSADKPEKVQQQKPVAAQGVLLGSMGWPIIGETIQFFAPHKLSLPEPFFVKRIPRYGRMFKSHIYGNPAVICTDPTVARYILQNEGKLFRSWSPVSMKEVIGKWTIIFTEKEMWKKQRQLLVSFMNSRLKDNFLPTVEESVLGVMKSWKDFAIVTLAEEARSVTFSVIIKQMLSLKLEDMKANGMLEDFADLSVGALSLPIPLPGTQYYRGLQARKRLCASLSKIVEKRRLNPEKTNDFLDGILADSQSYTMEQILDFMLGVTFGGFETTASAITLAVKFLKDNPETLAALQEEHQAIRARKKPGEMLTWDDYASMKFTNHVIFETLRLGGQSYVLFRRTLEELKLNDFVVPKGWSVIISNFAIHTNPELYPDPFKFNPWRWESTSTKNFLSFGGGPRKCPGYDLAKLEASIFLHYLVTRFSWEDLQPQDPMIHGSVRVPNGYLVKLQNLPTA